MSFGIPQLTIIFYPHHLTVPLFKNICDVIEPRVTMSNNKQDDDIIKHIETLAVIEKCILVCFVRKIYKIIYNELKEKSNVCLTRFLITGTSGIGKTYTLMQLCLRISLPFLGLSIAMIGRIF
jgi:hypothetical protein